MRVLDRVIRMSVTADRVFDKHESHCLLLYPTVQIPYSNFLGYLAQTMGSIITYLRLRKRMPRTTHPHSL